MAGGSQLGHGSDTSAVRVSCTGMDRVDVGQMWEQGGTQALSPGPWSTFKVDNFLDKWLCLLHTGWAPRPLIKGSKSPGELLPNESLPPIAGHWHFRQTFMFTSSLLIQ